MPSGGSWSWSDESSYDFSSRTDGSIEGRNCAALNGLLSAWKDSSCDSLLPSVCKKETVIESHESTGTVLDGVLADTPLPTVDSCADDCPALNDPIENPVDEASCDELEYENHDGTCATREECGRVDTLDVDTGRWTHEVTYCAPRCPDPLNIWNAELLECEPIIPPLTCEEKLVPHFDRESEVLERYNLQQSIMIE